MVGYTKFTCNFKAREREAWARLLVKVLHGIEATISVGSKSAKLSGEVDEHLFEHAERMWAREFANLDTLIKLETEEVRVDLVFWRMVPRVEFCEGSPLPPPSSARVVAAIDKLVHLGEVSPFYHVDLHAHQELPLAEWPEVISHVHRRLAIKHAYLSPKEPVLRFENNRMIKVTESAMSGDVFCYLGLNEGGHKESPSAIHTDWLHWKEQGILDAPILADRLSGRIAAYMKPLPLDTPGLDVPMRYATREDEAPVK
jgi:hypothetical protein